MTPARERVTDVLLLRHGVTAWNRERRIQGQTDIPLDGAGVAQAHAVARRLAAQRERWGLATSAGRPAPVLLSSDLARCRQTAEPIADALALPCRLEPGLRERAYGAFEGCTPADLKRDHAEHLARWRDRDPDLAVGGGESLREFAARIAAALDALLERHGGGTMLLVTHGGVLDVVHRIARGLPLAAPRDFDLPNVGLNHLRHDDGGWRIVCWADADHDRDALDEVTPR